MDVLQAIHDEAFASPPIDLPLDMQGWIDAPSVSNLLTSTLTSRLSRDAKTPLTVLEVGSWKGLSTCFIARHLEATGIVGSKVVAIDTWLGSTETVREVQRDRGRPRLYHQFLSNVQRMNMERLVYPFPMSSAQAAHFFSRNETVADVVYLDAGQEYLEAVLMVQPQPLA